MSVFQLKVIACVDFPETIPGEYSQYAGAEESKDMEVMIPLVSSKIYRDKGKAREAYDIAMSLRFNCASGDEPSHDASAYVRAYDALFSVFNPPCHAAGIIIGTDAFTFDEMTITRIHTLRIVEAELV